MAYILVKFLNSRDRGNPYKLNYKKDQVILKGKSEICVKTSHLQH